LIRAGANVHMTDYEKATPLRLVYRVNDINDNLDMIVFLAKHGARIGARDIRGESVLHREVFTYNLGYLPVYLERLKTLLNPVDLSDAAKFAKAQLAYDMAEELEKASRRRPDELGTDRINGYDEHGLNSLMQAVIRNDQDIVQRLLQNGINIDDRSRDEFEYTALQIASMAQSIPWIQLLLDSGADPFVQDSYGNTALHRVAPVADTAQARDMVGVFLKKVKDPAQLLNARNNSGDTVVHWAIKLNNADLVSFLADTYGQFIDHTLENNDSQDLIQLARALGRDRIEQILLNAQR